MWLSFFLLAPTQSFQDLKKSACSRNPKADKARWVPKTYWPISLLCLPNNILERLIYGRVKAIINPLLPKEQAGFQRGKSTVDQVVLLTQSIEDFFKAKKKAGVVFANLKDNEYDTVWHHGLTCKLVRVLQDKHMVRMITELVRNRSFSLLAVTASKASYAA